MPGPPIRKTIALLAVLLAAFCAVLLWSYSNAIASVPAAGKVVALTYDDGPNPPHTQALLALLAQHGVRATFFLKGRNVEAFPDEVRAIAAAGHEIGNHSYDHRPMLSWSPSAMRDEVARTNRLIGRVLGYAPDLFRPPYGVQGPGLAMALDDLGMTSILMNTHGDDWELTEPADIASRVLDGIGPGGIVLLHDGHGDIDDPEAQDSRAPSVAATGLIIEALTARGYRFVTVGELLALSRQ